MKDSHFFAMFVAICGVIALGAGGRELNLWLTGTPTPKVTTLDEVGSDPTPSNIHVTITDFEFADTYVEELYGREERIRYVWFPLNLPGAAPLSEGTPYPVIVRISNMDDPEARLQEVTSREQLTGILSVGMLGLGEHGEKELLRSIKQDSLKQAILLDLDRPFPSLKMTALMLGMAVIFFGVAAHSAFFRSKPAEPTPEDQQDPPHADQP